MTDTYDFCGVVMARSESGDAVAETMRDKPGVEVIQQPAFWDIRAAERMVIVYDEVAEELGSDVDGYTIQHDMSTHYGRMVAQDDRLLLFADPIEALEHF